MAERTFTDQPAKRERVPLLAGIAGASGCGKTYSALRLATGMQRVTGGDIYCIDTESRRALHYADQFKFRHLEFVAPFSPIDYLAAIEYCVRQGASIVIVDSMSHEHEGPGGVLEWHDAEAQRLADAWRCNVQKASIPAWAEPKKARRRLLNSVLQLGVSAIFCFRAKEKLKIVTGKDPVDLGWMPIAGEEFVFEQTVQFLLYPASGGVPTWAPELPGEKMITKLPSQFVDLFKESKPLSEDIGQAMAEWAAGDGKSDIDRVLDEIAAADTFEEVRGIAYRVKDYPWTDDQKATLKQAIEAKREPDPEPAKPTADPSACCPDFEGWGATKERPERHCKHCGEPAPDEG